MKVKILKLTSEWFADAIDDIKEIGLEPNQTCFKDLPGKLDEWLAEIWRIQNLKHVTTTSNWRMRLFRFAFYK